MNATIELLAADVIPSDDGPKLKITYTVDGEKKTHWEPAWKEEYSTSPGLNEDWTVNYEEAEELVLTHIARVSH